VSDPITINPARMRGEPCLSGTRLTVDHVALGIAALGVDGYLATFDLPSDRRRDCLIAAAWWTLSDRSRGKRAVQVRSAWTQWADDLWNATWRSLDVVDDPPEVPR
jgi:uncharacterized protein (DUF433 family)